MTSFGEYFLMVSTQKLWSRQSPGFIWCRWRCLHGTDIRRMGNMPANGSWTFPPRFQRATEARQYATQLQVWRGPPEVIMQTCESESWLSDPKMLEIPGPWNICIQDWNQTTRDRKGGGAEPCTPCWYWTWRGKIWNVPCLGLALFCFCFPHYSFSTTIGNGNVYSVPLYNGSV